MPAPALAARQACAPAFAVAVLVAVAGCAAPDGEDGGAPALQFEDDTIAVEVPTLPDTPPAPGERTLAQAPVWRLGEWWDVHLDNHLTGAQYDFRRVVAGSEAANYLVGFPADGFSNDAMVLHVPGVGDIARADLSYEVHDVRFKMLDFPLEEAKSWEMDWQGNGPDTAIVDVRDDGTASVEAPAYGITGTYDPEMGDFSTISIAGYATATVTGHGYGHQGVVRVPHDHDLVFRHGRTMVANDLGGPTVPPSPQPVTEAVEVDAAYDRISFGLILGGGRFQGLPQEVTPGYFRETVTAPDGTVYRLQLAPGEGDLKIQYYGHDGPAGSWSMEHLAGGAGFAFAEGIAYHSIDVDLPSGCVLASFNAQHHGSLCKA